jgi:trimethylamine--corrinoid protein Co-methyltransferase
MPRRDRRTKAQLIENHPEWRRLKHPFSPQEIFPPEKIADMHEMALRVLEELGISVLLDEAREVYAVGGAILDGDNTRIGRDMVAAAIATTPKSVRMAAPDPAYDLIFEEGSLIFGPGAGCPNVTDRIEGRRPGRMVDFQNAIRLHQSFDVIHKLGPSTEPQDIPVQFRHYDMMQAQLSLSGKQPFLYGRGRAQVEDGFKMLQLALDLDDESFRAHPRVTTVVNTNSPRLIDRPMCQALIDFGRAKQFTIITPFCLSGAMAPVTVIGALILQHAEALAALVLNQLSGPGAPCAIGGFGSNVDMKSGAPAFGTPEHIQMAIGTGQLCRHVGLPWRGAAGAASNTTDMQASGENHMALWGALMANATMVFHSAGWLEGGLSFGFEKFINDVEALQTIAALCTPPDASMDAMGWDALSEVDPGGHFFATEQTMQRYETAFYKPLVADLANFGTWEKNGAVPSDERATKIWQSVLKDYAPPPGAEERGARIARVIGDRKAQGGAPILD